MNGQSPTLARSSRFKIGAVRGLTLGLAFAAGVAGAYFTMAPSAFAATVVAGIDGDHGILQHLHGGAQSHAAMHAHFDEVLGEAGASPSQKQQIGDLVDRSMRDEHADMALFHSSMGDLKTLLTAPELNDAAVAVVRAEQDRLLLATSKRLSDTAVDIARILTPEQRVKLGAQIDKMMASHHHGG